MMMLDASFLADGEEQKKLEEIERAVKDQIEISPDPEYDEKVGRRLRRGDELPPGVIKLGEGVSRDKT